MTERVFLGMLTPSSNTILEPVTTAMISGLPEVTAHFSRFKVTEIALSGPALAQFDDSEILRAAELLAHAKVNVIAWNGTSSGWLGFERDVQLCERITQATGIPACTAMLALNELLERTGREARRLRHALSRRRAGAHQRELREGRMDRRVRPASRHAGQFLVLDRHRRPDAGDDARRRGRQARCDRDRLHQHARRAARRGA